ncbi:MAG TPA: translocation/assembly module TamB domain-containing protein [Candidatus Acidoferrales bacterium]|nr:translocation/assembly module TamB domain-containing protein [Candidatus Acidoferrales bacterium]
MTSKKRIRHALLALAAVIVIVVVAGYIMIHTHAFNRFVAGKIIEQTEEKTGAQLSIGKMVIHWGQLKVDFYDLALRTSPKTGPPFFACDRLRVGVKILSIWKRKIDLQELILDRPVLHALVDAQGRTNFPHSAKPSSASPVDAIFDLAIRHFDMNSGQIDYNDERVPVSADLHNLQATVQFNASAQNYDGSLSYDHGRIAAKALTPFEHDARMVFAANRSIFAIHSLALSAGGTHLTAQATLTDYSHPRIQGTYQATIFTPDLARVLNSSSIPDGQVQTSGSLACDAASNQPFLSVISVDGRMDAPDLAVHADGIYATARQVRASYVLHAGSLRVADLAAQVLGGSLNADFSMSNLAAPHSPSRLNASLRGVSLSELTHVAPSKELKGVRLAGRANAEVQAAWTGTPSDASAHVHATIYGPLTAPVQTTIPVNGFLDVRYDGARDTATFAPSTLRTTNTQISLSGVLGKRAGLNVQASARDLHEVTQLISAICASKPKTKSQPSKLLDLRGSANFVGQITGSPKNPRIHGRVIGDNIVAEETRWNAVQADFDLSSSGLALQNASLKGNARTAITFNGRIGLQNWSFTPASPLSLQANASGISLTDLQHVAKLQYPVAGNLTAKIAIHGSENDPAGQASLEVSKGSAWGEAVTHLAIRLQGNGNSVHASAQLQIPAGPVSADVIYAPKSQQYDARLSAPKLVLTQIQFSRSRNLGVNGVASISASGKGTIERPQLTAQFEIPQLQVGGQTISQLRAQLNVTNQHANFTLNSSVIHGYAQAKGDVDLRGNYFATASVDARALQIGALLASYVPKAPQGLEGQTELHATLSGPLKQPAQLKAQAEIPTLDVSYQSVHLGLADPMKFAYANGVLSVDKADMKGNGTQLSLHGTVPLRSNQPLNLAADGTLDLGLIQDFSSDIKSSGKIHLHITAQGGASKPTMQGQIRVVNAMFSSETFPLALEGVNGQIGVAGNRLDINQLNGAAGGGNISASGFLIYGAQPNFKLSAHAKSVRIRYPQGIRSVLDANLGLTGTSASSSLTGRVLVDRLSFTQQFDMANLIGRLNSETPATPPPPFEQNMKLNVTVATTQNLNLTSSKLSMGGSANLNVTGSLADPVILGRISLTQGEVFFMGKRYEVQNGTIAFANPVRTEPVLNIYAKTTVQQYDITLNFVGPIDRLRTNYTSTPPLSQADIINLIAFGKTAEQAASSPSTPASVGAESVLAQGVAGQVSGKVEKLAGISQISIDPLASNSQANPASQLAIQQRISGSLLLIFSTDVTSTQAQTVEVEYTPNKRWTISVIRDENGGYGIDARIHKVF